MVKFEIGNLLDAPVDYICHQVNCQGRMGSGIAKQIRERWPAVYDFYITRLDMLKDKALGHTQLVPVNDGKVIINMFAQQYYGYDGKRYTSYDAFWACLGGIRDSVPKGSKIGFPWGIGCGLGGANWEVISTMIDVVLRDDYDVYIYCLREDK